MKKNDAMTWPRWVGGTKRQYFRAKNRELRKALAAMNVAQIGCAYYPDGAYQEFKTALALLRSVQRKVSKVSR